MSLLGGLRHRQRWPSDTAQARGSPSSSTHPAGPWTQPPGGWPLGRGAPGRWGPRVGGEEARASSPPALKDLPLGGPFSLALSERSADGAGQTLGRRSTPLCLSVPFCKMGQCWPLRQLFSLNTCLPEPTCAEAPGAPSVQGAGPRGAQGLGGNQRSPSSLGRGVTTAGFPPEHVLGQDPSRTTVPLLKAPIAGLGKGSWGPPLPFLLPSG